MAARLMHPRLVRSGLRASRASVRRHLPPLGIGAPFHAKGALLRRKRGRDLLLIQKQSQHRILTVFPHDAGLGRRWVTGRKSLPEFTSLAAEA